MARDESRIKAEYVKAVTRGEGFMPWQEADPAEQEFAFRDAIERRKKRMLASRGLVRHPVMLTEREVEQVGRRVRYLDVINRGRDVASTFVAIHEPSGTRGAMPIRRAERLEVPRSAGPNAVAIRIESRWGMYLVLSEFSRECEVDGVRFKGAFGVFCERRDEEPWLFALGAKTLRGDSSGFSGKTAAWSGRAETASETAITPSQSRPRDWPPIPDGCQNFVRVYDGRYHTGFPVEKAGPRRITVGRFPLQQVRSFRLPALSYVES